MNANGSAAYSPVEPMKPIRFDRWEPRPDDVAIEILYTSVCHTDLHAVRKRTVMGLLDQFGWPTDSIIKLDDITDARALEMYSRLTFALAKQLGHFDFNMALVRGRG